MQFRTGIGVLVVLVALSGCQLFVGGSGQPGDSGDGTAPPDADWNSSAAAIVDESMRRTAAGTPDESVAVQCTASPSTSGPQSLVLRARFRAANGTVLDTVYSNVYTVDADGNITVTLTYPQSGAAAQDVATGNCSVGTT